MSDSEKKNNWIEIDLGLSKEEKERKKKEKEEEIRLQKERNKQKLEEEARRRREALEDLIQKATYDDWMERTQDRKYDHSTYEYTNIVPDCIARCAGEIPIKQYNIAKMQSRFRRTKAYGRLQVTTKRIIYRAVGRDMYGRICTHQEFFLDEVAGVEIEVEPKVEMRSVALAGLFIFLSTIACIAIGCEFLASETLENAFFYGGIGWVISTIIALLLLGKPSMQLIVKTKGSSDAIDVIGGGFIVRPWDDTDLAIRELGTLINDAQKNGLEAVVYWNPDSNAKEGEEK